MPFHGGLPQIAFDFNAASKATICVNGSFVVVYIVLLKDIAFHIYLNHPLFDTTTYYITTYHIDIDLSSDLMKVMPR